MKQNRLLGLGLSVSLLSTAFACSETESTGGDADASTSTGGSSAGGAAGSGTGGSGTGGRATGGVVNTGGTTGTGGSGDGGSTGGTGTGGSSDGGSTGGADGSTPGAGGADGGAPVDGAAPAECGNTMDAGSQCNTLVNTAGVVTLTAATGTLPTGIGGTLVDGLYHATKLVYYPGSSLTGNVLTSKQTVLFCGSTTQQVQSNNDQPEEHKSGMISFAGIVPTFTNTCGTGVGIPWTSYTADNTMIALYSTSLGFEAVFTRQ